ncbi:hypothetical protein U9M48_042458 [Paspalum notatum var. saurae]|uniref:Reverse transcriptase Ty1/copia-type domain-containing protein n=1 Tax=Paspalum notatum var. saurae TaxID=547442 RepID=A0AAQ3XEI0_PASNO
MGSMDKTLFLLKHSKDLLIVQIYVDDIIFGGSSHAFCSKFSEQMSREFEMSMMGELQFFLGLQIRQTPQGTFVHQSKYTRDLLHKFEMADASPQMTPMSTSNALDADEDGKEVDQKVYRGMIGSLLYLTATRPDIQFVVGLCARFQASPRESHRTAVKQILRYIKFTPEFELWYSADSSLSLLGFSDSDHAGCRIDRKSTFGTCQFLGTSLSSVATSTCEAEYVAAASCCSQILWMLATLRDYGLTYGRIPILCDSSSPISVAKNPVLHSRAKHIDVRYHFLRDNYEKGMIDIVKMASKNQMGQVRPRRIFPKVFRFLTSKLGVQRRIGLLATWRTSEDCVEAKKIKSSSWSSVPDISAKYTRDILKKFNMGDSKPMTTPMSTNTAHDADEDGEAVDQKEFRGMIGSLLYLTATRPDIQFAVCLCARYQASPRTSQRQAVKRIFRYLKFTTELGLWYSWGSSLSLRGFSDADHAGCRIDRKSTSGTCQLLGTSLVSWSSRKQASVALSTTEAEYVAAASCYSQLLWMKATLSDFGLRFGRIPLLVDSTSTISVAKNPVLHSRTKHIDVRFHFLRDHYEKGDIELIHVVSANQLADIFTKPLEFDAFTLQVEGVDNALIKGEIESQWTGLITLLV